MNLIQNRKKNMNLWIEIVRLLSKSKALLSVDHNRKGSCPPNIKNKSFASAIKFFMMISNLYFMPALPLLRGFKTFHHKIQNRKLNLQIWYWSGRNQSWMLNALLHACMECDRLRCWPPRGWQVSHQKWIWGIRSGQARKQASQGSTLALNPRADITISPKQGFRCRGINRLPPPFLGPPWIILTVVSGTHFS